MGNVIDYCNPNCRSSVNSYHIICYGDSNTAGFRPPSNHPPMVPWGVFLERALNLEGYDATVEVIGNSGLTARELYEKRMHPSIPDITGTMHPGLQYRVKSLPDPPDLVIIMLGTNDLGESSEEPRVFEYMSKLHEVCHQRGIRTVALAAITLGTMVLTGMGKSDMKQNRDALARHISSYELNNDYVMGHLDPRNLVPREPSLGLWEQDGLHWSDKGQAKFGKAVAGTVKKALDYLDSEEA
jgi:lysophospholipase L1-like esterase